MFRKFIVLFSQFNSEILISSSVYCFIKFYLKMLQMNVAENNR